ncbi:hypothetical protein DSO57_1003290 [Entomophthora muscae]|uniref:Uncharacterized protein n=1 Tax=Entomophthora muscae TaxID=34485 RepID=A0ACC2T872_9FUNG|nr:hypothetical protein DSO57_1003290 [Entomophthora muscae]
MSGYSTPIPQPSAEVQLYDYSRYEMVFLIILSLVKVLLLHLGAYCPLEAVMLYLSCSLSFLHWELMSQYPKGRDPSMASWYNTTPRSDNLSLLGHNDPGSHIIFCSKSINHFEDLYILWLLRLLDDLSAKYNNLLSSGEILVKSITCDDIDLYLPDPDPDIHPVRENIVPSCPLLKRKVSAPWRHQKL